MSNHFVARPVMNFPNTSPLFAMHLISSHCPRDSAVILSGMADGDLLASAFVADSQSYNGLVDVVRPQIGIRNRRLEEKQQHHIHYSNCMAEMGYEDRIPVVIATLPVIIATLPVIIASPLVTAVHGISIVDPMLLLRLASGFSVRTLPFHPGRIPGRINAAF
ncbi:hypothetical protein B0H16DRAFT_333234 [Mycena metata]|uniref:Uncharacterized protein n=1 Tax=Mycena metata TaxID=1033252 RepID=A0AAD7HM83_9AGAR|nr:hypothetical protein B0H16DRAFT_333234 [Mycena metata]